MLCMARISSLEFTFNGLPTYTIDMEIRAVVWIGFRINTKCICFVCVNV